MTNNIIVTGFGPFRNHNVNASWEAVKLLPDSFYGFNIIKQEIPVTYYHVENYVPDLWNTFNPIFVFHVGVSSFTNKFTIEKCAFRKGYDQCDSSGATHPTMEVCCEGDDCILTGIDVEQICNSLNICQQTKACSSTNAGRYLCEFIYYTSLNINRNKSLFVHVPPLNEPYTAEQLAEGLLEIIRCVLEQLQYNFIQINEVEQQFQF
ncbi:pyroglutamyl-peptidase 1 [Anoplophora glabripennis]|uniref:pyroglutamyl-peptidase 1 n=1 Tax=Anoplophora glabripennis TaxID=217634 RepID=UPI00087423C4|nr:pyroglutamyl-peptidase 1 [Anoplophora glabripennis]